MQAAGSPERPRSRAGETSSAPLSPGHLLSRFIFSSGEKSPACSSPAKSPRKHPILSCLSSKSHKRRRQVEPLSPDTNSTVSIICLWDECGMADGLSTHYRQLRLINIVVLSAVPWLNVNIRIHKIALSALYVGVCIYDCPR